MLLPTDTGYFNNYLLFLFNQSRFLQSIKVRLGFQARTCGEFQKHNKTDILQTRCPFNSIKTLKHIG